MSISSHRFRASRSLALVGALLSANAFAQTLPPSAATNDAEQQRRAQQRLDQVRQQQESGRDSLTPRSAAAAPLTLPVNEAPCFVINEVQLLGKELTAAPWLLQALSGPDGTDGPIKRCIGAQGVDVLLKRAQQALINQGYVTTRALAETQSIKEGKLTLTIVPGYVSAIRFKSPEMDKVSLATAFPIRSGDLLNLRDIEQALDNLNRIPGADADIQIAPAAATPGDLKSSPGLSDLVVSYTPAKPLRASVSVDDSGTHSTGKYQGSATISVDNPLRLSDLFYVTLNHDLSPLGLKGNAVDVPRGTRGWAVHYSVPYGHWLLSTTWSGSRYHQTVAGASQDYLYSGSSRNAEVKLERLLYRDQSSKLTAHFKAFQRQSNNFIDDTEIQVQRRVVGGYEAGLRHKTYIGQAQWDATGAIRWGTGGFGSLPAPEEAFGEGTSRFRLLALDANLIVPFKVGDTPVAAATPASSQAQPFKWVSSVKAQLALTPLTPQDRLAIGGRATVRGFDGELTLAGDSGVVWRNELSTPLMPSLTTLSPEAYVALDAGHVRGPSSVNLVGRTLVGSAFGLRGQYKGLVYDGFMGIPVHMPDGFRTSPYTLGFTLNYNF